MNHLRRGWILVTAIVATCTWGGAAAAQEFDAPVLQAPTVEATPDSAGPDLSPAESGMGPDASPGDPALWDYEHMTTNRRGNVNLHRRNGSPEDDTFYREHSVTNPQGQHVQTWERSRTEDGYLFRREHTFADPEGTLLREHRMTLSGTDPYNYQREQTHTLRDGRTITRTQTRTWDGTAGSMEHLFTGPNGQTRQFVHPWTPDDETPSQEQARLRHRAQTRAESGQPTASSEETPNPLVSFFRKLNPFAKRDKASRPVAPRPGRRAGFTVGSTGHGPSAANRFGLANEKPGKPTLNPHRVEAKQRVRSKTASRPHPARGGPK